MRKVIKNFKPFWKSIIVIFIFLCIQAVCDLSLPTYTSNIIDTGIQNKGITHILPEEMTKADYDSFCSLLTKEEKEELASYYKITDQIYSKENLSSQEEAQADETYLIPMLLHAQMSKMTTAQLQAMQEKQIASQQDPETSLLQIRSSIEKKIETTGTSLVRSSAISQTIEMEEHAGIDLNQKQTSYLWKCGGIMLGMALIMALATIVVGYFASRIGAGIGKTIRNQMFEKVVRFSNAEMDRFSTASLITRTTNDVQQIQLVSTLLLRMIAYAPILGVGGVIKVWQTGAGMGWVIGLTLLVLFGFVGLLMSIAMPKFKIMQTLVDQVNLVAREILTGLSVIRAFGREQKEEERFDQANKALTKTTLFTNRVMTFMMPGMMLIMYGLTILIMWVASHKIDQGVMEVGTMTAFITYAMQIVLSFLMLSVMSIFLPRAIVSANRIDEVDKTAISIVDTKTPQELPAETKGELTFSHVSFRYPNANEDVLHDINFTAKPGEITAIIGSTGCGKSTLVQLIPRLYDVTQGQILLDGISIDQLSLHTLRAAIGFVPQKGILFSGTIASNISYGNPSASLEEIQEAATVSQAMEFISEKENTFDSEISQGGSNVSGGQKQRLAIARAIAKKASIYIFDDSFSALDVKTDAAVRKALAKKMKESTVLIVAQRISTILHADQILVIDDGKIVGKGTHQSLMKECEVYQQIAESQLSQEELQQL
ncbi:MAG: ABC transporter ATP-binding protein [Lachnospiraceae bacterium]|nr:ABC transporter ATP-binding protein [Lachnospiraceae bacterium]